jgi:D-3-phosphoglycerate dehydrogenase
MARYKVVVTDTKMSTLEAEREVLGRIEAEVLDATHCQTEEEFIEFAQDADGLINERRRITQHIIESLPRCKVISRYAVGMDSIDIPVATEHGICVANVPDFCIGEVADHTMALLLACNRWLLRLHRAVEQGTWGDRATKLPLSRIRGQTLGLIGFGRIARAVAERARPFGLKVIAFDPYVSPELSAAHAVDSVDLDTVLAEADYLSIHVPITNETEHMLGEAQLRRMKPTAYLINASRGTVVDEQALVKALEAGWIAGAGLDVVEKEPLRSDNPLFKFPNVVLTPHTAFHSVESLQEVLRKAAEEVARVLQGQWPRSLVNPDVKDRVSLRD